MSGEKYFYAGPSKQELEIRRRNARRQARIRRSEQARAILNSLSLAIADRTGGRARELDGAIGGLGARIDSLEAATTEERGRLRRQLQETVRDSDRAMRELAAENRTRLAEQADRFQRELDRQQAELGDVEAAGRRALAAQRSELMGAIEERDGQLSQEIRRSHEELAGRMGSLESRLDGVEASLSTMARSNETLLDMAREYALLARTALDDAALNFRCEILLPGRLARARAALSSAEDEVRAAENGLATNAPVARREARAAIEEALRLREDLVAAEQLWQAAYQAAQEAVSGAAAQVEASRHLDIEGIAVDADFWCDGGLDAVDARVRALGRRLDDPAGLTAEDLDGIRHAGEQAYAEAVECAEFAGVAVGSSEDRVELAADVAEQLCERLGLHIDDHGYQADDERRSHRVRLVGDWDDFDMTITQRPEIDPETGTIANRLESDIHCYGTNNQEEGDRMVLAAFRELAALGYDVGPVQTVPGYENRPSDRAERRDMHAWRTETETEAVPAPDAGDASAARERAAAGARH